VTLTPLDIHNKEFGRAFRGYAEAEVDEFLDAIVKEFEALIRENGELKDRLDEVETTIERYRSIEDTLNKTLLLAQQASEDARLQAERESEVIRERARMEAQRIIDDARERTKQALADYSEMRKEADGFRIGMRTPLASQLEVLEDTRLKAGEADPAGFGTSRRAETIAARYRGPGRAARDEEAEDEPEDERREEAATLDFRRVEPARPNLWGEPAHVGERLPGQADARRTEPLLTAEPARSDEDEEDW
jgi:cell division initiation protein